MAEEEVVKKVSERVCGLTYRNTSLICKMTFSYSFLKLS